MLIRGTRREQLKFTLGLWVESSIRKENICITIRNKSFKLLFCQLLYTDLLTLMKSTSHKQALFLTQPRCTPKIGQSNRLGLQDVYP